MLSSTKQKTQSHCANLDIACYQAGWRVSYRRSIGLLRFIFPTTDSQGRAQSTTIRRFSKIPAGWRHVVAENKSPRLGFGEVSSSLRSVVGHAKGIPLVLLFDFLSKHATGKKTDPGSSAKAKEPVAAEDLREHLRVVGGTGFDLPFLKCGVENGFFSKVAKALDDRNKLSIEISLVIKDCLAGKRSIEIGFTKLLNEGFGKSPALKTKVNSSVQDSIVSVLKSKHQGQIEDLENSGGYDMALISCKTNTPIILFEVGLHNSVTDWWTKAGQALSYVSVLSNHDVEKAEMERFGEKPMLMSVVTVDKDTFDFKVAVFLCWNERTGKRIDPPCSLALLWRTQSNSTESNDKKKLALSSALACLVSGALWLENESSTDVDYFSALGPNCCKVTVDVRTSPLAVAAFTDY
jgi:hypothetical protein